MANVARDRDRLPRRSSRARLAPASHLVARWWWSPSARIARAHAAIVTAVAASRQRRPHEAPTVRRCAGCAREPAANGTGHPGPVARDARCIASTDAAHRAVTAAASPRLATGSAPVRMRAGVRFRSGRTIAAIPAGRRAPDDKFAPRYLPDARQGRERCSRPRRRSRRSARASRRCSFGIVASRSA